MMRLMFNVYTVVQVANLSNKTLQETPQRGVFVLDARLYFSEVCV